MKIFHNARCSKSRETLQLIEDAGVPVEIVEYLKVPITEAEIRELLRLLGMKAEELVRKTEPIFKEKYKGKRLSEDQWIKAMIEQPRLIQRPIVVKGDQAILGRPPESVKILL